MSSNHKPMARPATLPPPPPPHHHSLPDPPLACVLPHTQYHRDGANASRNQLHQSQSTLRRPDRSRSRSRSRPPAHGSGQRGPADPYGQGQQQHPGGTPIGRDYASANPSQARGHPVRSSHTRMAHASLFQQSSFVHHHQHQQHQQQQWAMSYDESRRMAGSSSSRSHPSPASTSSASTSSLRTPPDLLLNGNTIGHVYPNWKSSSPQHSMLALNSWSGLAVTRPVPPRHLKVDEIAKRRRLLASLPDDLPFALPSPPHTPLSSPRNKVKTCSPPYDQAADAEPGEVRGLQENAASAAVTGPMRTEQRLPTDRSSRKRRRFEDAPCERSEAQRSRTPWLSRADATTTAPRDVSPQPRKPSSQADVAGAEHEDGELPNTDDEAGASARASSRAARPAVRATDTATKASHTPLQVRSWTKEELGRLATLYRHCGRERKHAGDQLAEKAATSMPSFTSPASNEIAALEQLDAVLLFCYAFYLSDQEKGSCLANNWLSLFGLLRYVTNAHSRSRNSGLVGLCRLVEALVLRILHTHDQHLLRNRIATQGGAATAETLATLSEGFVKLASDLERSDRLASQASRWLSVGALQREFPNTWSMILATGDGAVPADGTALRVDPGSWPSAEAFAWPIGPTTPIPHLVCFGRNLLCEHAKTRGLEFQPVTVKANV